MCLKWVNYFSVSESDFLRQKGFLHLRKLAPLTKKSYSRVDRNFIKHRPKRRYVTKSSLFTFHVPSNKGKTITFYELQGFQ